MTNAADAVARDGIALDDPAFAERFRALVGDARIVLLGEATHGTREFYRERARLSLLLADAGFAAIAIEADWPDAYRVNRWVRCAGDDATADEALGDFTRFPRWLWRNREFAALVERLRARNASRPAPARIGVYGIDLYSLHRSMAAVIAWLDSIDPAAADRAREAYACFDAHGGDPMRYGRAVGFGLAEDCEREAVAQLVAVRERALAASGALVEDAAFCAERNAAVAVEAERYYRAIWSGSDAWNQRDRHMADTVAALVEHLSRVRGEPARIAVWAHNSHLGDARATAMGERDQLNLGQLLRERYGRDVLSIGFTTARGAVRAADEWDEPGCWMRVRPASADSYEAALTAAGADGRLLPLRDAPELAAAFDAPRPERFIGVIYRPDSERVSHWQRCCLPRQFDAVIHIDRTHALAPLDAVVAAPDDVVPETYPSGV